MPKFEIKGFQLNIIDENLEKKIWLCCRKYILILDKLNSWLD